MVRDGVLYHFDRMEPVKCYVHRRSGDYKGLLVGKHTPEAGEPPWCAYVYVLNQDDLSELQGCGRIPSDR